MKKGRRSEQVRGWVNFPVNDPDYKNSKEGGMFVRLVFVPQCVEDTPNESFEDYLERKYEEEWMVCCGGDIVVLYDECLLGDDVNPDLPDDVWAKTSPAETFHFPRFPQRHDASESEEGRWLDAYTSRPYLCAMTIGSTGWSGWHEKQQHNWRCRFEDLTEEGKALYKMLEKLYEGRGKIYLQTWLDT